MTKRIFTLWFAFATVMTTMQAQGNMINGHEYVDLGLPSGTLWATCNVGANNPEEKGNLFAWGETEPKENGSWSNYKWSIGTEDEPILTKYCESDKKKKLDLEDDAAYVNWGNNWCMPSDEQMYELCDKCYWQHIENKGYYITGPNRKGIFLPFTTGNTGREYAWYWSHDSEIWRYGRALGFGYNGFNQFNEGGTTYRVKYHPLAIRPVVFTGFGPILNQANFPDDNFRAALAEELRIEEGEEITKFKIAVTKSLFISGKDIQDLTGIEHFTALEVLECYSNRLTSLDVSKNTALTSLGCGSNRLTSLDVSKNTALKTLWCDGNRLTSLDVSKNTKLTTLRCDDNQLTSLDISKNTVLTNLYCSGNRLTALDVSKNFWLEILSCNANQLTSLNMAMSGSLRYLTCYRNRIKGETMDKLVDNLPFSQNKASFYVIDLEYNDEGNVCTKLQVAVANAKNWTVYDAQGNSYLGSDTEGVKIDANNFPDANFRAHLLNMDSDKDGIFSDDEILEIKELHINNLGIKNLTGVEHFVMLRHLDCSNNQISTLNVSKNFNLEQLLCNGNQLTSLNILGLFSLKVLNCGDNQLTSLDVSGSTALERLSCQGNQLTYLNLESNSLLSKENFSDMI